MVQKTKETTQRTVELVRPVTRPRIVGEIPVAPKDLTTPHSGSAPLTIQLCAHNYMPYTIYLIDRSGAVFRIPPSMFNNVGRSGVYFDKKYSHDHTVVFNDKAVSTVINTEMSAMRKSREDKENQPSSNRTFRGNKEIEVVYHLTEAVMEANGGSVYLHQIDLVVTKEDPMQYYLHPGSKEVVRSGLLSKEAYSTYWQIVMVDHDNTHTKAFVNLNGEVFQILPERNPNLKSGFYVFTRNRINDAVGAPSCRYYSFEEGFDQLPVFVSAKEAEDYGDLESRLDRDLEFRKDNLKLQLAEKEAEVKALQAENIRLKSTFDQTMMEIEARAKKNLIAQQMYQDELKEKERIREEERKARDHQLQLEILEFRRIERERDEYMAQNKALREERMAEIRDQYEQRSHVRKDTSEATKHLPLIVTALVAAGAVFTKLV